MKQRPEANDGIALVAVLLGVLAAVWLGPLGPALFSLVGKFDPPEPPVEAGSVLDGMPFEISSMASGFSVTGTYRGVARFGADGLEVSISAADLRTRVDLDEGNTLVGIRVELARSTGGSWHAFRSAELHAVGRPLGPGEAFSVDGFEAVLSDVTHEDLSGSWLIVAHELAIESSDPDGYSGPAWTYAHGGTDFLASLVPAVER